MKKIIIISLVCLLASQTEAQSQADTTQAQVQPSGIQEQTQILPPQQTAQPPLPSQQPTQAGSEAQNNAFTLTQCYKLALLQSELIAVNSEKIKQAQAHFLQAFGTLLPQVSFSYDMEREYSTLYPGLNKSYESKFIFKQALFSGFKEFAGMSGGRYEIKQRKKEKQRAEQLLFIDVSDAFYLLLEQQEDLKIMESLRQALLDRIEELKKRQEIGKSRESEVVNTRMQLFSLEAQMESVKSGIKVSGELLNFLIGRPSGTLSEPLTQIVLRDEAQYAAMGDRRPDVEAAYFNWMVSQKQVNVAQSGFLPKVNVEGNYFPHRNTAPKDSSWATFLRFEVPIFEGTTNYGNLKEALSKSRESSLLYKRAGRSAEEEIHQAFANAQSALLQSSLLEKAFREAELNYKLQTEDYRLNLVGNLDVLTALQSLEDNRRNYTRSLYESRRFYRHLQSAAGQISLE